MQKYTVMGSAKGDGGMYLASSPKDAFIKHIMSSWGVSRKEVMRSEAEAEQKSGRVRKISSHEWVLGDYEIKKVR